MDAGGVHAIGFSNDYPGGYAEQMMLSDLLTLKVPNGLDPRHAALTEPMAVGLHAVESSRITPAHAAVVFGCGPVGLAVVAALHLAGVESIVAADFSPPGDAWPRRSEPPTSSIPATSERWSTGGPSTGVDRLVIFEAIGVPASSTRRCSTLRASRRSWWWAHAWSPTPSGRCWDSARN